MKETKTVEDPYCVRNLFPALWSLIQTNPLPNAVESLVAGDGDSVIMVPKNQLIAITPYTLSILRNEMMFRVIVLTGEVIEPTGEVTVIVMRCQ